MIETPIFLDLGIWAFRITKKGKPAQVKSVNTLIAKSVIKKPTPGHT